MSVANLAQDGNLKRAHSDSGCIGYMLRPRGYMRCVNGEKLAFPPVNLYYAHGIEKHFDGKRIHDLSHRCDGL